MADGEVIFEIRGDHSKLGTDLSQAESKVKTGSNNILSMVKNAAAGIGALKIAEQILSLGSAFETSMAKASTLYGNVNVDTNLLSANMLDLSDKTGIAADELGNGLYSALSAGIPVTEDMSEATGFLEKNAKLAKAGFTDLDSAVNMTAKVLNAYNMDVDETDKVHKVLIQTQNQGIVTVNELNSCLANVTPTAAAAGVSFEEVGAGIATLTAKGTAAAQATTQLNALYAELGKTGSVSDKALRNATATVKAMTSDQVTALKSSYEQSKKAYSKSLDERLDAAKKSYQSQEKELDKSLKNETKAFEEASNQKIKAINNEYTEKIKLVDEDRYNAIKALDEQINTINGKTKAEEKALEEQANKKKLSELEKQALEAKTSEEHKKIEEEITDFKSQLERKKLLETRENEITDLKTKQGLINDEADAKIKALKDESSSKQEALKNEIELEREKLNEKQDLQKEAFSEQKNIALDNIKEINDADIAAYQTTIDKKLEIAKNGSGDGKSFSELIQEGKNVSEILDILQSEADKSGLKLSDMFGSLEAGKAAMSMCGENADIYTEKLKAMSTETDVVSDAAQKMEDTTADKFKKAVNSLKNIGIEIFNSFAPVINTVLPILSDLLDEIAPLIKSIGEFIGGTLGTALEILQPLLKVIFELLSNILSPIKDLLNVLLPNLQKNMEKFGPCFDLISKGIKILSDLIGIQFKKNIECITNVLGFLLDALGGLIDFIIGVFTGDWEKAWGGIKDFFSNLWNSIVELLKSPINEIISMINGMLKFVISSLNLVITAFNTLHIDVPDWIPVIGGKKMGFDIPEIKVPEIPKLKVGMDYVPSDEFPALLHQGEAVLTADEAAIYRQLGGKGSLGRMTNDQSVNNSKNIEINMPITNNSPKALSAREIANDDKKAVQRLVQYI